MGFFSNEEFIRYKKCTQPVYQTPASIQQMLDIAGVHENGIFEIEPNNGAGKKRRKFDRVYSFSDLNYVDQDKQQKDGILFQLRKFLNSMDTDFKITIQCEPRDVTNFQKSLLQDENKSEYPELARYNNEMIKKSLEKGQENVRKQRYLTVSANCRSIEEAEGWFDTFEHTALPIFHAMGSELVPLNAVQRFQKIRNYFFTDDGEESFILPFQDMVQAGRDFRNSILPHSVRNHKSYMEFDEECMRILFAAVLPTRLNEEKLIFELTDFPFYTCLTIDTAYIPREVLRGKISNTNFYNENAIGQEVQANASMGNFYSEPSYAKKKKQANLKKYMDQIEEDDENGFYVGILLAVRGANKEELDANTAEVRRRCRKHSIQIVPYYDQQIQALNTLLPIGARRVNNMRSVLTSSYLAFQPFYSWDLIQPGGTWYGINKKTRNPIIGNRKTLKNSNGVIFGHTGSGKSMLLKITEIGQTLINSTDDIFLIDPQNEMKGITQRFRGQYFDLSDPDLRLNPLEIPESLLQKNAKKEKETMDIDTLTKQEFRKLDGRQCYHFIISFAPGETDAITCFNIAQDFCEKYLAGKYEYVFSVHTDHAHMHAHIVFNSVSLVDGVKYHYSDGQWKSNIQPITDQLCEKYGLKKLTYVPGKRKGVDYGTWREKKDPSGSQRLREAIDMAIAQSDSYDDFLSIMRKSYQVKIGFSQKWNSEYLSFKDFKTPAGRYRRNYVLGKSYTVASIQKRISLNKMEIPESLKRLPPHIRGFESSIGSGFRSANGLYLTQHQKRYMIPYWRLKNSERTVTSGTGNIREYSKEADRNLRDLQTVQDNKIRTVQDLSSRLDELNQMTDSIRRELRAIQSSREDSETENVISEYLSIQSAFANAAVPIEMEGKFENRLDEIEENYPIEELIHQKESNSKKEKQLQKEIKNLQQASRRLSKLKKIQKR